MKTLTVTLASTIFYLKKLADIMIYPLKGLPSLDFNDEYDSSML